MGVYNKLRDLEDYLKYTTFENLKEWFSLIKDNLEEALVKCNGC